MKVGSVAVRLCGVCCFNSTNVSFQIPVEVVVLVGLSDFIARGQGESYSGPATPIGTVL